MPPRPGFEDWSAVIRVNRDPRDQHADRVEGNAAADVRSAFKYAKDLANPDRGSTLEYALVNERDPGAARFHRGPWHPTIAAAIAAAASSSTRQNPAGGEASHHQDVEFAVDDASGNERIFKDANQAAGFALALALGDGRPHNIDVLIWSEEGAEAYGGDDAVEQYREDPEASVFERIVLRADSQGRVP